MEFIKHLAWRTERKRRAQTGAHANAKNKSPDKTLGTDRPHFPTTDPRCFPQIIRSYVR